MLTELTNDLLDLAVNEVGFRNAFAAMNIEVCCCSSSCSCCGCLAVCVDVNWDIL